MDGFGQSLGGSAMTALIVAVGYAGLKLFRRSKCATHTACCDFDIARGQPTERVKPEFETPPEDIEMVILRVLEKFHEKKPEEPSLASQVEKEVREPPDVTVEASEGTVTREFLKISQA